MPYAPDENETKLATKLQALLGKQGVAVLARFEPAEDESVDDQISFKTPDGAAEYPVVVQLSGRSLSVNVHEFDAKGHLESVTHGGIYNSLGAKIVDELAGKLQANPPRPVEDAEPTSPGMRR